MDKLNQALEDVEKETKMNTKPNEVLIFKDQFPLCCQLGGRSRKNHPSSADDNKNNDF